MAKGPILFDLEQDSARRPSVSEAPAVFDTITQDPPKGQAMQIAARLAARRPSRLMRLFWGLAAIMVGAFVSLAAWTFITDLMVRYPLVGTIM